MDPAIGAALIGAGTSIVSGLFAPSLNKQRKYQESLMSTQNMYNQQNMALQNQYAEEAWRRQAEYNDPANVRARYEAAGISPQAALGGGVTGAGIAGVMEVPSSTNPSGGQMDARNRFSNLASDVMAAMSLEQTLQESKSREDLNKANARKATAEASNQEWLNSDEMRKLFTDERVVNISDKRLDAAYKEIQNKYAEAKTVADLQVIRASYEKLIADKAATLAQKEVWHRQLDLLDAQITNLGANTRYLDAQTETENFTRSDKAAKLRAEAEKLWGEVETEDAIRWFKVDNERASADLKDAQSVEAKKRAKQVDAEIERIGKLNGLTDEEIVNIQSLRNLAWAEFGVNAAKSASEEARKWVETGKSLLKPTNVKGFSGK